MLGGRVAPRSYARRVSDDLPSISVIVAFKRDERCILDCIASALSMDYPTAKLEVIVVDDSCDDVLADAIRARFPAVHIIRNRFSLGCDGAKQVGLNAATCDIVAFTDADCTLPPFWARTIAKCLSGGAEAVTGPVRHPKTFLRELVAVSDFRDSQSDRGGWTDAFPGCNFAVWRSTLEGIPYDRSGDIRGGSDRLLSWFLHRSGWRIASHAQMGILHAPSVMPQSLFARRMMYGRTAYAMRKLDPTLPGSIVMRLGPLSAPAYVCCKTVKDLYMLARMAIENHINPLHVPMLIPALFLFRLVDAVGILTAPYVTNLDVHGDGPPQTEGVKSALDSTPG